MSALALAASPMMGFADPRIPRSAVPALQSGPSGSSSYLRKTKGWTGKATAKGRRFKGSKAAKAPLRRIRGGMREGRLTSKANKYWRAMAAGSKSGYGPPMSGVTLPSSLRGRDHG